LFNVDIVETYKRNGIRRGRENKPVVI